MIYQSKLIIVINPKEFSGENLDELTKDVRVLVENHSIIILSLENSCLNFAETMSKELQSDLRPLNIKWPKDEDNDIRACREVVPEIFRAEVTYDAVIVISKRVDPEYFLQRYRQFSFRHPISGQDAWVAKLHTPKVEPKLPKYSIWSRLFCRR